jgi:hypothetical protein
MFRAFLDGQLLISAQATAAQTSALYGSAALDLPRRGVNHVAAASVRWPTRWSIGYGPTGVRCCSGSRWKRLR